MKKRMSLAVVALMFMALAGNASELAVDNWLVAGPAKQVAAVEASVGIDPVKNLFDSGRMDALTLWPASGTSLRLNPTTRSTFKSGDLNLRTGELLAGAVYLDVPEWQRGSFVVRGAPAFRLWLEGEKVLERTKVADAETEETVEANLVRGKRRLLILAAGEGSLEVTWTPEGDVALPTTTQEPRHPFDIADYWMQESCGTLDLSPDGRTLAATISHFDAESFTSKSRFEVVDVRKQQPLLALSEAQGVSEFAWSNDSEKLLLAVSGSKEGTTDLLVWTRKSGVTRGYATGLENASGFVWAPDDMGVYYTVSITAEENETPYKVEWGLMDRFGGWRDRQQIRYMDASGTSNLIWEGLYGADGFQLSADGKSLFLMRTLPRSERPYEQMELVRVSLTDGGMESLFTSPLQRDGTTVFTISPKGDQIAFVAGRYEVTGNDNANPNITDADGDLWILDLGSGEAKNVSRDFEPSVGFFYYGTGRGNDMIWHPDGEIVFSCLMNKKVMIGSYDPSKGTFSTKAMPTPGFNDLDIAEDKGVHSVAFEGTRLDSRLGIYVADRRSGKGKEVLTYGQDFKRLIDTSAKVVDYNYTNSDGVEIPGYLYYPYGYDPDQSYPMIIDYYGGVIGYGDGWDWNSRTYQSQGYFVYTPIPRGAAGYGADFANTHPNDWGMLTSRDINEGVRDIVKNVPGVDGDRVAPTSGSYGGYLTVYLLAMAKDNPDYYPYATGIAHAGIYDMMDYWGKGEWGFLYMDMAAAGSWPWNATEKYIQWSPVYYADNITAPLLITHGEDDNNVPPESSWMLYTALKVLDRDNVWFVHYPGQKHGLVQGGRKTYLDSRRMRIEWFDKFMRDQPGAWDWRMRDELKK